MKTKLFIALTVSLSLCFSVGAAEIILRYAWQPSQSSLLDYPDVTDGRLKEGGLLKRNFKGSVTNGLGGEATWINNTFGFRNSYETPLKRPLGIRRFLSLGDSFTAGYRVGQNETYSYLLEQRLNKKHPTQVLVSMIGEPVTGLHFLKSFGHQFKPDGVFLGLTLGNDLAQTYSIKKKKSFRGELSHALIPPNCLKQNFFNKINQGWHYFLGHSKVIQLLGHDSRAIVSWYGSVQSPKAFDPVNGLGFFMKEPHPEILAAYESLFQMLADYKNFEKEHKIPLTILIMPQVFQVQQKNWEWTLAEYGLDDSCFDLNLPNKKIINYCNKTGLTCIDPTAQMKKSHSLSTLNYYLPLGDMHWNAKGHEAFVEAIWEPLNEQFKPKN